MHIFVDKRIPVRAMKRLGSIGTLIPFVSQGLTYDSITGHPDVFMCLTSQGVVVAPNTPAEVMVSIEKSSVRSIMGVTEVGSEYPGSAAYNAFVNASFFIHNLAYSDPILTKYCQTLTFLNVRQGYTRCNLVEAGGLYITSDRGIEKVLNQNKLDVLFVDPGQIKLPGQRHGFFGGCTGVLNNTLFLLGSSDHFEQGGELKAELKRRDVELVELYDGPLWDGGSILFL